MLLIYDVTEHLKKKDILIQCELSIQNSIALDPKQLRQTLYLIN
jgi:hypothetical protein